MVSLRALAVSAITFAVPLVSALTAQEIVSNVNALTTKSQALQAPAQSINIINGPLILIGQGPFPVCDMEHTLHATMLTAAANYCWFRRHRTDRDRQHRCDAS